jgi:hypothetical protein
MTSFTKLITMSVLLGVMLSPCYADTVTQTTTTTTTIRNDAPIYTGPVQVTHLEELSLEDFQGLLASKPVVAMDEYREYKNSLDDPNSPPVLYKLKIVDRDLTVADFQGVNVTPDLAQARYEAYMKTQPVDLDGEKARYVYVYHRPIVS